ncbi:MAG: succinate dehydrogenase iron-sulfur subunit, partial [Planctomycetota bacterium]
MIAPDPSFAARPDKIVVRIKRQESPGDEGYWELHEIAYEPQMNVISVLQRIAAQATTVDGKKVSPVAWDCGCLEEVCGSCTMVINGRVRQSCSALVDRLLEDNPDEIVLEPMSKFPVVRDLVVDRERLFRGLQRVKAWVPVDSYYDMGAGERILRQQQEQNYPLSQCMSCGCCVEACPQYTKVELERQEGESEEDFQQRKQEEFDRQFVGPHAISQAMLFNNHPTGKALQGDRM